MLPLTAFITIVGATFVSEDLTAIGLGLALREGSLPIVRTLVACFIGIYLGDVGLWAAGRFGGRRALKWRGVTHVPAASLRKLGVWIDQHPALAILSSRFLPGTRVPMYVAAGIWGEHPWRVLAWMLVSVALWTPLIVLTSFAFGDTVAGPLERWLGATWIARVITAFSVLTLFYAALIVISPQRRQRLSVCVARLRHWEFWPVWLFNLPVAAWIAFLGLRYQSLTVFTAANPGFEDGGLVGESKSAILSKLPPDVAMPWTTVDAGTIEARLTAFHSALAECGWSYPLVAKPDVGERGTGVRWLFTDSDARRYFELEPRKVMIQLPHEGPFEAGVFYVRMPGESRGRLFSITDKRFPVVVGDGHSTLEELIRRHPRYRLQARVFLARHEASRHEVLAKGRRFALARAGNHCQGTEFLDGWSLRTPALEARVDEIARQIDGFWFGRFDVRYKSRETFMAGDDFSVIELNGVTSEATHIYDPSRSLLFAWRTLMRQWSMAFAIGAANQAVGHQPTPLRRILVLIWTHIRSKPSQPISD